MSMDHVILAMVMNGDDDSQFFNMLSYLLENDREEAESKDEVVLTEYETRYIKRDLTVRLGLTGSISPMLIVAAQLAMKASNGVDIQHEDLAITLSTLVGGQLSSSSHEERVRIFTHILTCFHIEPTPPVFDLVRYFVLSGDELPNSLAALGDLHHNLASITHDSDRFCREHRLHVPTPGLGTLCAIENDVDDRNCSICQHMINKGSFMYQLPCGDCFHATSCLGTDGILTWLQSNKKCPNCAQEVCLPDPTTSSPIAKNASLDMMD